MSTFPIRYDPEEGTIHLDGEGGASVMLSFLLKAKFGEAFDEEVLFHAELASILDALRANSIKSAEAAEGPFDRTALHSIAKSIVRESWRSGWWEKPREEQVRFIQSVVVAPYRLSPQQLECLFDFIDSDLAWRRRVVEAADLAGEL